MIEGEEAHLDTEEDRGEGDERGRNRGEQQGETVGVLLFSRLRERVKSLSFLATVGDSMGFRSISRSLSESEASVVGSP